MLKPTVNLLMAAALLSQAQAASILYDGLTQNGNLTAIPWVTTTTMWGSIETGSGQATAVNGLASVPNPALLSWTFGDLELSGVPAETFSPGVGTPGRETYKEIDLSTVPLVFSYDGDVVATGSVETFVVNVDHVNDFAAVGNGKAFLTAPGADPSFYNEVLALTGGTGELAFSIGNFNPVNGSGLFSSSGEVTFVPEPSAAPALFALAGLLVARRRR